jgi:CRISPR/Cas system CMR-associated protein Cmr5 small subunit
MKNLEQIRARNALACSNTPLNGERGGELVKKIASFIQNNGLLPTAAFCKEQGGHHELLFNSIATHLGDPDIGLISANNPSLDSLLNELTNAQADSLKLQRITAETNAWMNYARRFINRA